MNSKRQQELLEELMVIVEELGWVIGTSDSDQPVSGFIVGTEEFVYDVADAYYGPGYSTFESDAEGEIVEKPPEKKTTLH